MPGRGGWIWALPLGARGDSISLPRPPAQIVVKHDVGLRECVLRADSQMAYGGGRGDKTDVCACVCGRGRF
jgi:hypothetical protein